MEFLRFSDDDYYSSAESMKVPIEIEFTDKTRTFEKSFLTRCYPYFRTVFRPRKNQPRVERISIPMSEYMFRLLDLRVKNQPRDQFLKRLDEFQRCPEVLKNAVAFLKLEKKLADFVKKSWEFRSWLRYPNDPIFLDVHEMKKEVNLRLIDEHIVNLGTEVNYDTKRIPKVMPEVPQGFGFARYHPANKFFILSETGYGWRYSGILFRIIFERENNQFLSFTYDFREQKYSEFKNEVCELYSHLDQAVAVEPVVLEDYDGQFRSQTEINEENSPAAWKISIKAKRRKFFKFPNGLRLLEKKCRDVSLQFLLIEVGENLKFVPASEFFLKSDFVYEPVVEVL